MDSLSIARAPARSFSMNIREQELTSLELLTSRVALEKILEITCELPDNASPFWGFEIPLSNDAYTSDFLCCINDPQVMLPGPMPDADDFRKSTHYDETYMGIRKLCAQWIKASDRMGINNIWLEFDCKDLFSVSPVANFFFGPKDFSNHLDLIAVCENVFKHVTNHPVNAATYKFLLQCARLLPSSGYISQVGMMLARNHDELRLFIQGLGTHGIEEYLQKVNYRFIEDSRLRAMLADCYQLASRVDLDIDIANCMGDCIGIECYFDESVAALKFLEFLQENGLCSMEKRHRLENHLQGIIYNPGNSYQHFLSHIKIVFSPHTGFRSKVYLGYARQDVARKIIKIKPLNEVV